METTITSHNGQQNVFKLMFWKSPETKRLEPQMLDSNATKSREQKWGKQALVDGLYAHTNADNFGALCAL